MIPLSNFMSKNAYTCLYMSQTVIWEILQELTNLCYDPGASENEV